MNNYLISNLKNFSCLCNKKRQKELQEERDSNLTYIKRRHTWVLSPKEKSSKAKVDRKKSSFCKSVQCILEKVHSCFEWFSGLRNSVKSYIYIYI